MVEVAAEDSRIAAVVAHMPFNGFARKVEGRIPAETRQLLWAMLKYWWHGRTGRPPHCGTPARETVRELMSAHMEECTHYVTRMNERVHGHLVLDSEMPWRGRVAASSATVNLEALVIRAGAHAPMPYRPDHGACGLATVRLHQANTVRQRAIIGNAA